MQVKETTTTKINQSTGRIHSNGPLDVQCQVNSKVVFGPVFEQLIARSMGHRSQGSEADLTQPAMIH